MDDADREALRRRLYRAGVTEEDRRRYRAVVPPPEEPEVVEPRHRGRRVAGAVAGVLAVIVLAVTVPALQRPAPAAPTASPSVVVLPTDGPEVVFAEAGTVLTYRGTGARTVRLATDLAPDDGTMTVLVDSAGPASWYVERSPAATTGTADQVHTSFGSSAGGGGVGPFRLDYRDSAPDRVEIDAPDGVRWTLVVTFLRGRSPA